jgi:predicted transposase/invertase (TIGR01784 family)
MAKKTRKQTHISNPHDRFFKAAFSMSSVVKGYLNYLFLPTITARLNLDLLRLDTNSYISHKLKPYYSDIVWRCQLLSGQWIQIAFLFEHKSYKPNRPHLQILRYMLEAWEQQPEVEKQLIPIIPIIVYHGAEKWHKETFEDYFGALDTDLQSFIPEFDYWLTNLQDYPDEMIMSFNAIFLQKALLAFKHYNDEKYIRERFVEWLLVGYKDMNEEEVLRFIQFFNVYLYQISGEITDEEIDTQIAQLDDNIKQTDMTIIDKIMNKGIEKGIVKGVEKGKKLAVYDAWLKSKDLELLSNLFSLSPNDIKKVIKEIEKSK